MHCNNDNCYTKHVIQSCMHIWWEWYMRQHKANDMESHDIWLFVSLAWPVTWYVGSCAPVLTHWDRTTHLCVNKLTIIRIMACRLNGAKPLSDPMLEYCQFGQTSVKSLPEFMHFHSRKCIWKFRLENVDHFVLTIPIGDETFLHY